MKKMTIAIVISTLIFVSCNQVTKNTEVVKEIGINRQILNAIDSIPSCTSEDSFITITFTDNTSIPIIDIVNRMIIPVNPKSQQPDKQILISEWDMFIGYKKYKNRTLVFLKNVDNNTYSNFLNKDSLKFDERPFLKINLSGNSQGQINDKKTQIVFRIAGKDSLLLLDKKDWPLYLRY